MAENPKDKIGSTKVSMHYVPPRVMLEVSLALLEGGMKYGSYNFRVAPVRASVYYSALNRHLMAWLEGQDIDPDSGLSHITKAIACLVVLRDGMISGQWIDDRPPVVDPDFMDELNALAKAIIEKYPDPKLPFTQKEL